MKILLFPGNQPCLDVKLNESSNPDNNVEFGLNRDRCPDRDWGELRNSRLSQSKPLKLTELGAMH